MPRYHVKGADKRTGEDMERVIDAASYAEAEDRAAEMGMVIATVEASPGLTTSEQRKEPKAPSYAGLRFAGGLFVVVSIAQIAGVILVGAALGQQAIDQITAALAIAGLLVGALASAATGLALEVLADIGRNVHHIAGRG